jgi:zinc transporter ZupT
VSGTTVGVMLALYGGFFLSMGATDLLPEAHTHPSWKRIVLTVAGVAATWAIVYGATAI